VALRPGAVEDVAVAPGFWNGKRVLVTGHTGFKGSWLCLWLNRMGADVTGYSVSVPTDPSLFELARVENEVRSLAGDVRDREALARAFEESRPEIVIHMAAQSLVRRSYRDPVETYDTNVTGTVNVLEAVRTSGDVRAVVNVTTDKVYEQREGERSFREDEPKGGHDPYSNSKACSELVTSAYRESFFGPDSRVAVATVRAGNVIGGGDWGEDRLIPDIMRAALDREELMIRNPDAIRPWQHVLNPLSGYLKLAESLWESDELADGWNFGPEDRDARPVGAILERLSELWGEPIPWRHDGGSHPHEAMYLRLDSSKARVRLGWIPRWDLDQALASIVSWYKAFQSEADLREHSLRQIEAFTEVPVTGTNPVESR
jgi:CDP-glucose 4,6-dehydratase